MTDKKKDLIKRGVSRPVGAMASRDTHFGSCSSDSKRIGQLAVDVVASGEALYKYTRKPDNITDMAKSPVLFERNVYRSLCLNIAVWLTVATSAFAQGPAWWFARGVVVTNQPPDDYALITQGQLKWMATNACAEMDACFGAGSNVTSVVTNFSSTNNYYPANIGQLKYVVQPFYDRLYDLNLTNTLPAGMPGYYPWGNSSSTNDFALANIGQAKYAFSFDSAVDSDDDGLSDWQEKGLGTDPYDPDTDGDGLSDGYEVTHNLDPLDNSDAAPEVIKIQLEEARQRIIRHWRLFYGTMLVFTNTPGSVADLNDMKDALNALSGKFYKVE